MALARIIEFRRRTAMSCRGNPTRPGSGPGAICPSDGGPQPCILQRPCCCCVDSVAIQNIAAFNNGSQFGHTYDFVIDMTFAAGASATANCTLQWREKTNVPAIPGHLPDTWMDLYSFYSQSPTFDPWNNRVIPCPGGGHLRVTITDPPAMGIRPGRTTRRTLEFRLSVTSGGGCSCANALATATATQVIEIVDGVPTGPGTFTTP